MYTHHGNDDVFLTNPEGSTAQEMAIRSIHAQVNAIQKAARIHANARKMLTDTRTYMQLLSHAIAAADDDRIEAYDRCAAHAERMLDTYGTVTFAFLDDLAYEYSK